MSHRHFCDFAGHYWNCEGSAVRLFDHEASMCICLDHGVPREEEGDHSKCSVELLSCPDHRDEQMLAMGYQPGDTIEPQPDDDCTMFMDKDGNLTVGFCLWCNKDFYTGDEVEAHNANDMADCPVYQELKDEHCGPPVLQKMFEDAGLLDA